MILPKPPKEITLLHLRLDSNIGLVGALNAGLRIVMEEKYTYIARLDAGDTVNFGRLKAQYEYLEENPGLGIVGTQLRAFDVCSGKTLFYSNNSTDPKNITRQLKIRNCLAHPTVMMRTQVFSDCGLYDPIYEYAEDYEMWCRISRKFGIANLPQVFVNKEISKNQITALHRRGSCLSRLRAQLKYFEPLNIWCWAGVLRSIFALTIPRDLLKTLRSTRVFKFGKRI